MKQITKYIFLALILILFFVSSEIAKSPKTDSAQIYFLSVGQGDSELIQKGDYQILIDGGPDDSVLAEIGRIMPTLDRKIETVILSHPHADHLRGLNLILDRYEIGTIYSSGVLDTTDGYLEFLSKVKEKKINFVVPNLGDTVSPFENGKVVFVWPGDKYKAQSIKNLNNSSVVNKFCYYSTCAFFTGDIEKDEQDAMIEYWQQESRADIFKSEIYKMPHHGSSNGVNEDLVRLVAPRYGVIEVGADNMYGHPHPSALELFKNLQIPVLRTDLGGTIKFDLDQHGVVLVK